MNYIEKYQTGSTIVGTSFSPKWDKLQSKPVSIVPKSFKDLMPMKNPAYRDDIMLKKNWSVLDEYNSLNAQEDVAATQLQNTNLNPLQTNKYKGDVLWKFPQLKRALYEWQVSQTSK